MPVCCISGEAVQLGPLEYKLLQLFMGAPGRIFTKRQIYEAVWNEPYFEDSNTVMVQISRLRDKLEDNARDPRFLITIKGLGYKLALQGMISDEGQECAYEPDDELYPVFRHPGTDRISGV